jgi:uncharacterized membrane protein YedE/YeeE
MIPLTGSAALVAAVVLGLVFGVLLHRGRVVSYDVIVNQFRLRDFTVVKVMFTAVVVGGIGVWLLHGLGYANYHIKSADLLAVGLGAAIFGVGMVLYGYCPGTGVAAIGTGSVHAAVGAAGMLLGGILYAYSFEWVQAHIIPVASMGKVRMPELSGVPDWLMLAVLALMLIAGSRLLRRAEERGYVVKEEL